MKKTITGIVFAIGMAAVLAAQTGKIVSPKAGDVWTVGNIEAINWNFTGSGTVRLFLMNAAGAKVGNIKTGLALTAGAYLWTVGQLESSATPALPANGYKIQMKLEGAGTLLDAGAGPFEIVTATIIPPAPLPPPTPPPPGNPPPPPPPPGNQPPLVDKFKRLQVNPALMMPLLRVTLPVDGTQVIPPIICPIAWTFPSSAYTDVKIFYYPIGHGDAWGLANAVWITQSTPNDGHFDWKLNGLERTGKYVVRVMTLDGKAHGESGVVTIAAAPLPPEQRVRVVARTPDQMLAKSASLTVKSLDCFYQDCGLATVTVKVRVAAKPADGMADFILSPDVGHPQFGSIFLRCQVEDPITSNKGVFSVSPVYDRWISVKGSGGSAKVREVYPQVVPGGESQVDIVFDLKPPVPLRGQLVTMKMPGDLFSGGKLCKQYFFPKIIVTVHLITQGGDVSAAKMQYLKYNPTDCDLYLVALPIEVNSCQEGVLDW